MQYIFNIHLKKSYFILIISSIDCSCNEVYYLIYCKEM